VVGMNGRSLLDPLTEREVEILRLIAEGLSNREIAQKLFLTLGTIKWYNKQIYSKLGVHNRTQAVSKANEIGLFEKRADILTTTISRPKHNLPAQITSFIGREREILKVKQLIGSTRLLTLTGPPGTGKTRLALRVATDILQDFGDGIIFVDLAPIVDQELVDNSIARILGVRESSGQPLIENLKKYLRDKQLLLILDNFEQVIGAAPLLSDLLTAASALKVLVTSREVLRIYGEQEYPVPPLDVPNLDHGLLLHDLSQIEAIDLFTQRAKAVQPDFNLTNENAPIIAGICVRLDGLPLAIELAAARVRMMTLQNLAKRLENSLGILKGGMRDLPPRQQTLHATIEWSYELLNEGEKELFSRLSVFQGGRTVESVEDVCGPGLTIDILDGLESLLNKSLLFQEEGPDGEPRFYMLETLHEYARAMLEKGGEVEALQNQHAKYFVELAESAEPELRSPREGYWIARLRAENNNLRIALAWLLDSADIELGLRLVGSLRDYWHHEGQFVEGLDWTTRVIEKSSDAPLEMKAKALSVAGFLAYYIGDHERGKKWCRLAIDFYGELDDSANMGWALVWLAGNMLGHPDEHIEGISRCEEGLLIFRELGDKLGMAQALTVLGELSRLAGDYERAQSVYEECLMISRELGMKRREAIILNNLTYVAQNRGDYELAESLVREALALELDLGSNYLFLIGMAVLAGPTASKGQPERAARLLGASASLLEEMGVGLQAGDQFEIDRYIDAVRDELHPNIFNTAWREGQAMTLDEAIAYALSKEEK
jgi:predicted ATPase/DNA-binding CsgD family transcriptional regulator